MRLGMLGLASFVFVLPALFAVSSCGSSNQGNGNGDGGSLFGDSNCGLTCSNGEGGQYPDGGGPIVPMDANFVAPDCPGCTFPGPNAPMCAAGTPAITIAYPPDGVLVPPNMNVISVQWTPFGSTFMEFEVDFANSVTDMRVVTKCAMQTQDTRMPMNPSGGCELDLDPAMWAFLSNQNRGGDPVTVTVRGTTDLMCATPSSSSVQLSFAQDDMLGAIYYWKSTVSAAGVGGDIWVKSFGDTNPEQRVTTGLNATCYGCHSLSRDGVRMVVYSDDNDSDDEYSDVSGNLINMTTTPGKPIGGGSPSTPGFSTFFPDHTQFLSSNGDGSMNPTDIFMLYDGANGNMTGTAQNVGPSGARPTMPDWSPDGKNVVLVMPQQVGTWINSHGAMQANDDHVFGGSLYLLPYNGGGAFGAPTTLLMSGGENNYYPGYSPDGQLIAFNRVPLDTTVSGLTGCVSPTASWTRACPNDSFSNPKARVMITLPQGGAAVVDLEALNGSPASAPVDSSNSWPKWSPFLQNYKGDKLLWIAFSSLRDYGLRVRNHETGLQPCYAGDSYEDPGQSHGSPFPNNCEQPQLWMAAVDVTKAVAGGGDPSRVAFWLPFQDITTHNHTPQWTQKVASQPQDAGACYMAGQSCTANPGNCCAGLTCTAAGTCGSIIH